MIHIDGYYRRLFAPGGPVHVRGTCPAKQGHPWTLIWRGWVGVIAEGEKMTTKQVIKAGYCDTRK